MVDMPASVAKLPVATTAEANLKLQDHHHTLLSNRNLSQCWRPATLRVHKLMLSSGSPINHNSEHLELVPTLEFCAVYPVSVGILPTFPRPNHSLRDISYLQFHSSMTKISLVLLLHHTNLPIAAHADSRV